MKRKIVLFDEWCKSCKHFDKEEAESPCDECLNESGNDDSHKPVYWNKQSSD